MSGTMLGEKPVRTKRFSRTAECPGTHGRQMRARLVGRGHSDRVRPSGDNDLLYEPPWGTDPGTLAKSDADTKVECFLHVLDGHGTVSLGAR